MTIYLQKNMLVLLEKIKFMKILIELFEFFLENKKYFLIPVLIFLLLFAGLMVLTSGSTFAPFIYAIF